MTTVELRERIHVTENEQQIFDLLVRAVTNFSPETKLRVAGGWVRDKLLGKESNDIDIAIEKMLANKFLKKLNKYLLSQGKDKVQGHVIKSKPTNNGQQSLETVKMHIYNHSIDLVHLRSEKYEENSRHPVNVEFGTPEKDAYRRDLTMNSLFYNLHTGLVEDFTGRGINDLKCGRIATPLPARVSFMDDPLRVLRAIRFGARFGFTLDEEVKEAASSEELKVALAVKISKERIGNEIDLMISGNDPVQAVTYLLDLKLFGLVFALPSSSEPAPSDNCGSQCRTYMEAMWNLIQTPGLGNFSAEQRRHALYAALLLPFRKMVYNNNKGKLVPVVNYIFKESMKRKSKDAETVVNIHRAMGRFLSLILHLQLKNNDVSQDKGEWGTDVFDSLEYISRKGRLELPATSKTRVLAGFLLRDIKDLWRVALLASLLLCTDDDMNLGSQLDKKREIYLTVHDTIRELRLDTIWDLKPLVAGSDIIKALQPRDSGPEISKWQHRLLTWQLAYPKGMPLRQKSAKRTKVA
ncbi:Poly A polymerase [Hirschfeldia incana]|nr:Poly A polymerase [Hirschfeldia incana]